MSKGFGLSAKAHRSRRLQQILDLVLVSEGLSVEELRQRLGVSEATIRRDLTTLETKGLLKRSHGAVGPIEPSLYEAFQHDSSFHEQVTRQAADKNRIAAAAAALVADGDMLGLAAGTTVTQLSRSIPIDRQVTVFTNAVNIAMELTRRRNVRVIVSGGELRRTWFSLVGPRALESFRKQVFDKAFLSVSGVSAVAGFTDYHPDEAAINRVLLDNARRSIVLADHTKFSVIARNVVALPGRVDMIITDTAAPVEQVRGLERLGVEIRLV